MEIEKLTPEKSLAIISQVISDAKSRFDENGFIYILWGALVSFASLSQFMLLKLGYYNYNYFPYFLMPLGGIYTWVYYSRKKRASKSRSKNTISMIVSTTWIILAINFMVLGFAYWSFFQSLLVPVMLILTGIGYVMSGRAMQSRLLLVSGILINVSAYVCIHLPLVYHSLLMGVMSLVFILIPSIIIYTNHLKKSVQGA